MGAKRALSGTTGEFGVLAVEDLVVGLVPLFDGLD
jgi:hypothetical protein